LGVCLGAVTVICGIGVAPGEVAAGGGVAGVEGAGWVVCCGAAGGAGGVAGADGTL